MELQELASQPALGQELPRSRHPNRGVSATHCSATVIFKGVALTGSRRRRRFAAARRPVWYLRSIAASRRWVRDFKLGGPSPIGRALDEVLPDLPQACKQALQRGLLGEQAAGHLARKQVQPALLGVPRRVGAGGRSPGAGAAAGRAGAAARRGRSAGCRTTPAPRWRRLRAPPP